MNKKQLRWSQLMTNLESVVQAAFDMRKHQDMTESQYDIFNETIWRLEQLARTIKENKKLKEQLKKIKGEEE